MFGVPDGTVVGEPTLEEINAKVPRKVSLDTEAYGAALFVFLLVGCSLIWFAVLAYITTQQVHQRNVLNTTGQSADATVARILSGHTTRTYYAFQVAGTTYTGDAKVPEGQRPVSVGRELPVLFLPSDPSVSHPRDWAWWTWWDLTPHLFVLFIFIIGLRGAGLIYGERRLARRGWVTEGTVTLCVPNKSKFMTDYEFRTDKNELVEGSSKYCIDEYKAGSRIRIIYLRHHPKRNSAYPMDSYQIVVNSKRNS